jgi:filamentous hemagglutinin family protein
MFNTRIAFPLRRTSGHRTIIGLCAAAALLTHAAHAQHPNFPEGHNVTFGNATVNPPGVNWQEINLHAPASVIEWLQFSIGLGNTVEFLGANNPAVLNYVNNVNADPSSILGHILAPNISVYLVNPAGVVFGQQSTVNAGQFIAAAAVLNNPEDFFHSNPQFDSVSAPVVNRGIINATSAVHLIGTQVRNRGNINVTNPNGFITLTAYNNGSVTLNQFGDRYHINLDGGAGDPGVPGILNSGGLNAPGGTIQLGAGDFYSVAINLDNTDGDFFVSGKNIHLGSDPAVGPAWNTAGHTRLSSNVTIDADLANFWGTVDSNAGESHGLTVGNAGGALDGNANFHQAIGSLQELSNLTVGGNAVAGSTINTDEDVDIAGSAIFHDDVTAGGSIQCARLMRMKSSPMNRKTCSTGAWTPPKKLKPVTMRPCRTTSWIVRM